MADNNFDRDQLLDQLPIYYKQLFPTRLFFNWLSYGEKDNNNTDTSNSLETYFERREFSFTLNGDIYIRYQSFKNDTELAAQLRSQTPIKIDIGAVFTSTPKNAKKGLLDCQAIERELVFDIDMTDYDDVRRCCSGADVCKECWPFLAMAAKILDESLRSDFGFKHLLWIFSGRRGIHCWICDKSARQLSPEARSALSAYLTVIDGGQMMSKKVNLESKAGDFLHPVISRALSVIDQSFGKLIHNDQKLFEDNKFRDSLNEMLKKRWNNEVYSRAFSKKASSIEVWKLLERMSTEKKTDNDGKPVLSYPGLENFLKELKLQLCYPRLDINVTKGINHLLKAPFCIHPSTGKVCVPLDIQTIDNFDPNKVPTIGKIIRQLTSGDQKQSVVDGFYALTDLKPYVEFFSKFLSDMAKDRISRKLDEKDAKMDF